MTCLGYGSFICYYSIMSGMYVVTPIFMVGCLFCVSCNHYNLLVYFLLSEGLNIAIASLMVIYPGLLGGYGLFAFLATVACEASLGLALLVKLLRRTGNGLVAFKGALKS